MGWRTIHFCDMCGAENVELIQQYQGEDAKCDPLELCVNCLNRIHQTCLESEDCSCNIQEDPVAIWDLNLFCYCPNCLNYINAFTTSIWDDNGESDTLNKEFLDIKCPMCRTAFQIRTVLNIMNK